MWSRSRLDPKGEARSAPARQTGPKLKLRPIWGHGLRVTIPAGNRGNPKKLSRAFWVVPPIVSLRNTEQRNNRDFPEYGPEPWFKTGLMVPRPPYGVVLYSGVYCDSVHPRCKSAHPLHMLLWQRSYCFCYHPHSLSPPAANSLAIH